MEYKGKKKKFTLAEQKHTADELKAKKAKFEEDKNMCGVKIKESE